MDAEKPKSKIFTLPSASIGLGITGTFSWAMLDPDTFKGFLSLAWKESFTQWLLSLFIAGIAYRALFRKDIEGAVLKIVQPLVDALNKVADSNEQTCKQLVTMNIVAARHGDALTDQGKRLDLIEQHLTPRKSEPNIEPQT